MCANDYKVGHYHWNTIGGSTWHTHGVTKCSLIWFKFYQRPTIDTVIISPDIKRLKCSVLVELRLNRTDACQGTVGFKCKWAYSNRSVLNDPNATAHSQIFGCIAIFGIAMKCNCFSFWHLLLKCQCFDFYIQMQNVFENDTDIHFQIYLPLQLVILWMWISKDIQLKLLQHQAECSWWFCDSQDGFIWWFCEHQAGCI